MTKARHSPDLVAIAFQSPWLAGSLFDLLPISAHTEVRFQIEDRISPRAGTQRRRPSLRSSSRKLHWCKFKIVCMSYRRRNCLSTVFVLLALLSLRGSACGATPAVDNYSANAAQHWAIAIHGSAGKSESKHIEPATADVG